MPLLGWSFPHSFVDKTACPPPKIGGNRRNTPNGNCAASGYYRSFYHTFFAYLDEWLSTCKYPKLFYSAKFFFILLWFFVFIFVLYILLPGLRRAKSCKSCVFFPLSKIRFRFRHLCFSLQRYDLPSPTEGPKWRFRGKKDQKRRSRAARDALGAFPEGSGMDKTGVCTPHFVFFDCLGQEKPFTRICKGS